MKPGHHPLRLDGNSSLARDDRKAAVLSFRMSRTSTVFLDRSPNQPIKAKKIIHYGYRAIKSLSTIHSQNFSHGFISDQSPFTFFQM